MKIDDFRFYQNLLTTFDQQKAEQSNNKCQTGGKPSTWFPPGGLVEQSTDEKQNNKDEDEDKDNDGDEEDKERRRRR